MVCGDGSMITAGLFAEVFPPVEFTMIATKLESVRVSQRLLRIFAVKHEESEYGTLAMNTCNTSLHPGHVSSPA